MKRKLQLSCAAPRRRCSATTVQARILGRPGSRFSRLMAVADVLIDAVCRGQSRRHSSGSTARPRSPWPRSRGGSGIAERVHVGVRADARIAEQIPGPAHRRATLRGSHRAVRTVAPGDDSPRRCPKCPRPPSATSKCSLIRPSQSSRLFTQMSVAMPRAIMAVHAARLNNPSNSAGSRSIRRTIPSGRARSAPCSARSPAGWR
jgi:hypothetical protein